MNTRKKQSDQLTTMKAALTHGRRILLNISFPMGADGKRWRLPEKAARPAMRKLNGFSRAKWVKDKRGEHERYPVSSLEKMLTTLKTLRKVTDDLGMNYADVRKTLRVAYLHGVLPWSSFRLNNPFNDFALRPADIAQTLCNDMQRRPQLDPVRSPAPALQMDVSLPPESKRHFERNLVLGEAGEVEIDGKFFRLQDVIRVDEPGLRHKLQCADSFSFVAMPYIDRASVQKVRLGQSDCVQMIWPVHNPKQVVLKTAPSAP